jgi:hypothetical protein
MRTIINALLFVDSLILIFLAIDEKVSIVIARRFIGIILIITAIIARINYLSLRKIEKELSLRTNTRYIGMFIGLPAVGIFLIIF